MAERGYILRAKKTDWTTPQPLFNAFHKRFNFTIDAAADPNNARLPRFWTKEDNALFQDWTGERIWCNPPFGREQIPFVEKAGLREADISVLLLPVRTDTKLWHNHIFNKARIIFLKGRITFEGTKNNHPSAFALCIWEKN